VSISNLIVNASNGLFLLKNEFEQESNWRFDNCYKFVFSMSGSMSYQTKKSQYSLAENQFILFNPHEEHQQLSVDKRKFLIEIDSSFLKQAVQSLSLTNYDIQFASLTQQHPQLTKWAQFVTEYVLLEQESINGSTDFFLDHSFNQLALLLVKNAIGTQTADINLANYKTINPQLHKTIQAMKENYQHPWTLEEMAVISSLSKFQFAHFFKDIVGVSPYSWLQVYRIIRSQELLLTSDKTVLTIAMECGFSSIAVYNQLFKRLYGLTPGAFRNKIKK
jgi:AraC-like DNA-binding protein